MLYNVCENLLCCLQRRRWFIAFGVWCVVCGVWYVVCGVWCVVCGVWCKACTVHCAECNGWAANTLATEIA